MAIVTVKDDKDYNHSYYLINRSQPLEEGIEVNVPDLSKINWFNIKKELHNSLHEYKLFSGDDVLTNEGYKKLSFIVSKIITERIYQMYRETGKK